MVKAKKIALIEPKTNDDLYEGMRKKHIWLGLGNISIGTILKQKGHNVTVINENLTLNYGLSGYDVVGISMITPTAYRGYQIGRKLKENFPEKKLIYGGFHPTFLPEEALNYGRGDIVVKREAESIIDKVIEDNNLEGIVQGERIRDLNTLPIPDFSIVKNHHMLVSIPIQTSRGCPHNCYFCSVVGMNGRKYRYRDTDLVIKELKQWEKRTIDGTMRRFRRIFFVDDNFSENKKRTRELLERKISEGIKTKFFLQARAEHFAKDEEFVKLAAKAGVAWVFFGLESTNQEELNKWNKKSEIEYANKAIENAHKYGIRVHGMYIDNGEGNEYHKGIDGFQNFFLTPLPGSPLFKEIKEKNAFLNYINPFKNPEKWKHWSGFFPIIKEKGKSPRKMFNSFIKRYREFYNKKQAWEKIKKLKFYDAGIRFMGKKITDKILENNKDFIDTIPYNTE